MYTLFEESNYIEWGEEKYKVTHRIVLNCKHGLLKILQTTDKILFIDTEGCPQIKMFQVSIEDDPNIYIFTDPVYLKYYVTILFNQSCKKMLWDVSGEMTRFQPKEIQIPSIPNKQNSKQLLKEYYHITDLQDHYQGAGLKSVIGSKYGQTLVVPNRKEFYKNKHWRYPNRSHLIYAALDVEIMKELAKDISK